MTTAASSLLAILAMVVLFPTRAAAQFTVCNKSSHNKIYVAIAYQEGERWVSRGWFNIAKDGCATPISEPLVKVNYYLYGETDGRTATWAGEDNFCVVRPEPFAIFTKDCASRNYVTEKFFKVDTGTSRSWTQNLTSAPDARPADVRPAGLSEKWKLDVQGRIANAARSLSSDGYRVTHEVPIRSMGKGRSNDVTITLEGGTQYRIVGRCDEDCKDLDLRLLNPGGSEVDSDTDVDAIPVVDITPLTTGTYTVRAVMADCTTTVCFYGIGVFARSR